MSYEFRLLNAEMLATTKTAWQKQLAAAPELGSWTAYEVWFDFFERDIVGTDGHMNGGPIARGDFKGGIYGVFQGDSLVALALANVSRNSGGERALKVMDLQICPELDFGSVSAADENDDVEDIIVKLSWVAATAITGALELSYEPPHCRKIKIYGDVPLTREFLTAIATALSTDAKFHVKSEGRWMVVEKKE